MADDYNEDCTCPDPLMKWMPHTTSIDTSVSLTDLRWMLDSETCPTERRALRRIITRRLASKVS
jgi:hypothetical protein